MIIAKEDHQTHELVPEDSHVGRCVLLADIGTQQTSHFGPKRQIVLGWELPCVLREFDHDIGPEPAMVSKFFTLSLSEKANLRRDLEHWRGTAFTTDELKGFNLARLLGIAALITVVHRTNGVGDKRAVVAGLARLPKGLDCPPQMNPSRLFDLTEPDESALSEMPAWIRAQVEQSSEWRAQHSGGESSNIDEGHQDYPDDIPF